MKKVIISILTILLLLVIIEQTIMKREPEQKVQSESIDKDMFDEDESLIEQDYGLKVGQKAPDFTLETIDGHTVSLKDLQGKKVLLNFWATWCPPCREEMPHMQNVYEKLGNSDVEIIAVNLTIGKESVEKVKDFIKQFGLTFPVPLDVKGDVKDQYLIYPIPTSYFIDANGVIRSKYIGPMDEKYILQQLKQLN